MDVLPLNHYYYYYYYYYLIILQLDEVVPHNGSFQLGDLNEELEKEETKTVTVQEPEIHKAEGEANGNTEARLRYKKDERYSLIVRAVKKALLRSSCALSTLYFIYR